MTDDHFARHSLVHQHGELTKENEKLRARIAVLEAALGLFIAYDETDDEDGDAMIVRYDEAIRAARAAYLGDKE
jgi:hypothetical protein